MNTKTSLKHTPVLLSETLELLNVKPGKRYIDATLGGGGHTLEILNLGGEVLGIDQDPESVKIAQSYLQARPDNFKLINQNFSKIENVSQKEGFEQVDGILFDLGFASFQMDNPSYGLTFRKDGPLDMRLDPTLGVTASDLVNSLPEKHLANLFHEYGDEPKSKQIARRIVTERALKPFSQTLELANLVESVYNHLPRAKRHMPSIHPATLVFQALRIAVNLELENLKSALPQAVKLLNKGGRIVVISFHSGEDRIVKNFLSTRLDLKVLTDKPITAGKSEVKNNPRARSAKLRGAEKI